MPIVAIGDLHISCKSDKTFEVSRVGALVSHLESRYSGNNYSLALLGDVFDSNSPSLDDIKLFYGMVDVLEKVFDNITIICGNHDWKVFDFLPQIGFTYISTPTTIDGVTYLPWTHLAKYIATINLDKTFHGDLLLTHARCTIEPFIKEEVDIKVMSNKFKLTVLGDIHSPYSPYSNVHYTSEPSQHRYKTYTKGSTGYIIINDDLIVSRVTTDLPYKCKTKSYSVADLDSVLESLDPVNRYKIPVKDTVSSLQSLKKLKVPHVKYEIVPIIQVDNNTISDNLKDMVAGKISIEQLLFDYVVDNYKFSPTITSKILKALK